MEITSDISKISKTVQRDGMFIFDVLSKYGINFVSNSIFLATENVVSFTWLFSKTRLRNYAETFKTINGYKVA